MDICSATFRTFHRVFVLGSLLLAGCTAPVPPGGYEPPITAKELVGTRLIEIRNDDLVWEFDGARVTIENGGKNFPEDVVTDILGSNTKCTKIATDWRFDDKANALVLTHVEVDGEKFKGEAMIDITPAGPVRVDLGTRQYNKHR